MTYSPNDPTVNPWISADFDHQFEAFGRGTVPVGNDDVAVLIYWYQVASVPGDCNTPNPTPNP